MRKLTTVLFGLLLAIGLSTSASALSVDTNPLQFTGQTEGSVSFGISGSTLTMEISITKGKLARSRVSVAQLGTGTNRAVVDAGSFGGSGVNVRQVRVLDNGVVEFSFKSSFFHQHIHADQTSDPHYVTYDDLQAGDVITFVGYRHNIFGSFASVNATIVPEPTSAGLIGLGLLGLAVAGRRRA